MTNPVRLPLFPLKTVLFPRGKLPLRIFEARYIDMVKRCMRQNSGFGILNIREGSEVKTKSLDHVPLLSIVGTEVRIIDFDQIEGNLLGILVEGFGRFRVKNSWEEKDHLIIGEVEPIKDEADCELLENDSVLVQILKELVKHPMVEKLNLGIDYCNGVDVSYRLTELLPLDLTVKQSLLELVDTQQRLLELNKLVKGFQK